MVIGLGQSLDENQNISDLLLDLKNKNRRIMYGRGRPLLTFAELCPDPEPRQHVLPPTSICPTVLDRQRSTLRAGASYHRTGTVTSSQSGGDIGPDSFQISPDADCEPLLVFVNPKSGGRQVSPEPEMRLF